jgi:hypothetical protein
VLIVATVATPLLYSEQFKGYIMKTPVVLLTSLTLTLLLSETDLSSDLLLFFLVGAIPGTDSSLSSGTMLALIGLTASLVLLHLARAYGFHIAASRMLTKACQIVKEQLTKRSLGQA